MNFEELPEEMIIACSAVYNDNPAWKCTGFLESPKDCKGNRAEI